MTATPPENADTIYGRLLESAHVSIYAFDRLCGWLEWLLEEDRWRTVAPGYSSIDAFLATVDLSGFDLRAPQRRPLVRRLAALNATQRAIARALGASLGTINGDIHAGDVQNRTPGPGNGQVAAPGHVQHRTLMAREEAEAYSQECVADLRAGVCRIDAALEAGMPPLLVAGALTAGWRDFEAEWGAEDAEAVAVLREVLFNPLVDAVLAARHHPMAKPTAVGRRNLS